MKKNQYKYYYSEQADEIPFINELKSFGFSLEAVDSHMLIFHDCDTASLNDECDIEVCVPVNKALRHEDFSTGIMEKRTYAKTLHIGAFSAIGRAHAAIIDWVKENRYEICGSPIEKYITASQPVFNPGSFKIEVLYPVIG